MQRYLIALLIGLMGAAGCASTVLKSSDTPLRSPQNTIQPNALGYFLPKGMLRLANHEKDAQKEVWVLETFLVPDPTQFYTLEYLPSSRSDDTVEVKLSQAGLLQEVKLTTAEKTGDIIIKVIDILKEGAKALLPLPMATEKAPPLPATEKFLDVTIDPDIFLYHKETEKNELKKMLEPYKVEIDLKPLLPDDLSRIPRDPSPQAGIYFRTLVPYQLTLKHWNMRAKEQTSPSSDSAKPEDGKGSGRQPSPAAAQEQRTAPKAKLVKKPKPEKEPEPAQEPERVYDLIKTVTIYLPNRSPILSLDLTRAPFVKKETTLTLSDGILTLAKIDKPSELLAAMDIPLKLVQAIVALPTSLVQFKLNYSTEQTKLLSKQLEEIKARQELEDYLKKGKPGGQPRIN